MYRDKLYPPNAEDMLTMDEKETGKVEEVQTETSASISEAGSNFIAVGANTSSLNEVRRFYKKVSVEPKYAMCNHRILVYRHRDEEGKIHQGYNDDGEHGAGRKLLEYLTRNNYVNVGIVVTRWYGGKHIGPKRFNLMEDALSQVVAKLK
ncbi:hypothetical protein KUTeg_014861 [Tegillarca granosa]|uniref:Impact N-terminal domain-containing protein n=1 Tax=Tegillarca granosa TaxID=220873 RepID=A0ABQ9EV67_TEGGR|nr:hypothetical protein KUTeg_014861 [Tegillarca granosa]